VQQPDRAAHRVVRIELIAEDALRIPAPQRAQPAVGVTRPGEHALLERLLPVAGQLGRLTGPDPIPQPVDPLCVVALNPGLHHPPTHAHRPGNLRRGVAPLREDDHLQPYRYRAMALEATQALELFDRFVCLDVHDADLRVVKATSSQEPAPSAMPNIRRAGARGLR
jgi:hypothetical protein